MSNKTCGECRFLSDAKKIGVCEKMKLCLCPAELPACSKFERKVITNGDVIRQTSNEELAKFFGCLRHLEMCPHAHSDYPCEKCNLDWLNAPAESQLNDAIQNVIKDGAKNAIEIHEAAYAPDMNVATKESEAER